VVVVYSGKCPQSARRGAGLSDEAILRDTRMSRKRKVIIGVVVVVVLLVAGPALLKGKSTKKGDSVTVRVEKPVFGELTEFVSAPGEVDAQKKVAISAKVSARILELPVKVGSKVTCGDPNANPPIPPSLLVRLDSKDLESELKGTQANYDADVAQLESSKARLAGQRADLIRVEATLEQAKKDLARQQRLLETKDVSEQVYDQAKVKVDELVAQEESTRQSVAAAELSLDVMAHQLEASKSRIDKAKDALSYTTILSPIDGTVTRVNAQVGEVVVYGTMNNPGTVILEVADLSKMIVATQADEMEVSKIKVGQKAKIHIQAYPEMVFDGEVVSTALAQSSTATAQRGGVRFYRTEVLIDPNGKVICSGFNADVDIETMTHRNALKIPSQAILSRDVESLPKEAKESLTAEQKRKTYATVVYKLVDGKAVVVPVRMGASDMTHTIVEAGLSADDKVIVGPFKVLEKVKHGDLLKEEADKSKKPSTASDKKEGLGDAA
jgi:HlyD family secretion protein